MAPGAAADQLLRMRARLLCLPGGTGMFSHPSWIDWSGVQVWDEQGGKVEGTRVVCAAALKFASVWWPRGQGWWQREKPCSTRGHCGLTAWPWNTALGGGNEAFPKAFSKQKPRSAVSLTLPCQVKQLSIQMCPPWAQSVCPAWGNLQVFLCSWG